MSAGYVKRENSHCCFRCHSKSYHGGSAHRAGTQTRLIIKPIYFGKLLALVNGKKWKLCKHKYERKGHDKRRKLH